jgi:ribosomal protein S18 acetylase RimI-like enzyme
VVDLTLERVRLVDAAELLSFALDNTPPRVAAYALEPRAALRRARLMAWAADALGMAERRADGYWIVAGQRRIGAIRLGSSGPWTHLEFVVLAQASRGTGAAGRTLELVEEHAREAGTKGVELYVDRRNYRALHLYLRHGFRLSSERRFIFEIQRATAARPLALASLPYHAAAEVLGTIGTPGLSRLPWFTVRASAGAADEVVVRPVLHNHRTASVSVDDPATLDAVIRTAFRATVARKLRVAVPFSANVPGGRLIAVLHRMEKAFA